jgi:peptidyl-dipeptidase A
VDRHFRNRDLTKLTRRTYDTLGLDVRGVVARSDLYGRPGKNQHAFCLSVGREYPYDVRVLANVRPDAYWMNTMLHEFGHAVYDRHINPKLPYFLRTVAHTCTTEAIALMMGALAEEPGWLEKGELDGDVERLAARRRADRLVFTRWALVMFHFEKEFYEDPDRDDLNKLWWDLVERLQLVNRPPERDEPDWAAKIHVAIAPVYYHNYVLGNLISVQLRNHLETRVTGGEPFYSSEAASLPARSRPRAWSPQRLARHCPRGHRGELEPGPLCQVSPLEPSRGLVFRHPSAHVRAAGFRLL